MQRETLVLLPGMMCDERLFAPQIAAFGDHYNIIVPKLDRPSITAMAEQVLSQIEAASFNLAGLSMGGIVAMEISRLAPDRVKRLALLDTNYRADAPARYDMRNRQIADVKAGRLKKIIIDEMKPTYLAKAHRHNKDLLAVLIDMAMNVGPEAFIAQSIALRDRADQAQVLKDFIKPSLVLCGAEDAICAPPLHEEMAEMLPASTLAVIPDSGHISTLEAEDAVNAALEDWLNVSDFTKVEASFIS